ncbi:hypothetical protein ACLOJK_013049 [Asimina triloba]
MTLAAATPATTTTYHLDHTCKLVVGWTGLVGMDGDPPFGGDVAHVATDLRKIKMRIEGPRLDDFHRGIREGLGTQDSGLRTQDSGGLALGTDPEA